ncbi:MAG: nodulation protein NfeD [Bacteroidetes bacterium]|nr:nodulation protein NfeD [Bacteroidota bacterium]
MRYLLLCLLPLSLFSQQKVYRVKVDGAINPASAEFIQHSIDEAQSGEATCLIIEIDTPGGLMKSMNVICKSILASEVPVVMYVSPSGSHCASAGVFIMMASHVAVMAPGTNIGAAHPVNLGGGGADSSQTAMMEKVTNDAVSYIRSLAEKNKRNPDWAEDAVRKSVSITETEALKLSVIDMVAKNFDSLLVQLDGRVIETLVGKKTIATQDAEVVTINRGWRLDILDILTDPNIAYILMMLGIYGLFFELYNPGSILPGVIGGICLILAFYSFHTLPINYAGLALILFAIVLFLLEIKVTSYGILSIGGVIALLLGSMMLIEETDQMMKLSLAVVVPVVTVTALFFLFIVGVGIKAQSKTITTGREGMIGESGTIVMLSEDGKSGQANIHGELWRIYSTDRLTTGEAVKVVALNNLRLEVKSLIEPPSSNVDKTE